MNVNRGLLFWGLALITAGAAALAWQQGIIDRDLAGDIWRLWPVVLIAIGVSIVLSRTPYSLIGTVVAALVLGVAGAALVTVGPGVGCGGSVPSELTRQSGGFDGGASVDLEFNCGELEVAMGEGSGWEAATAIAGDREVIVESTSDSLEVRSPDTGGWAFNEGRQRWEITLGSEVDYDLHVSANAADADLNLSGGTFSRMRVDPNAVDFRFELGGTAIEEFGMSMNAGSANLVADAGTALAGSISMNAGSVNLCAPADAAVRLEMGDNIAFSHNLEDSDLNRSGDTWTSDNFDGADRAIDLRVEGNAASFEFNPEGGCS